MKHRNEMLQHMAINMELPGESLPGLPLVEILGNSRVLLENHHGVCGYSCCEISVRTNCGIICIQGKGLKIAQMTKFRLVITGKISLVRLEE